MIVSVGAIPAYLEASPNAMDGQTVCYALDCVFIYIQSLSMLAIMRQEAHSECHISTRGLHLMGQSLFYELHKVVKLCLFYIPNSSLVP